MMDIKADVCIRSALLQGYKLPKQLHAVQRLAIHAV